MNYTFWNIAPIALLPFFAFVINAFIVKKFTKTAVGISVAAIAGSSLYAMRIFKDFVFGTYNTDYYIHKVFEWFSVSGGGNEFAINMGIYIDNMGATMLLMVTVEEELYQ